MTNNNQVVLSDRQQKLRNYHARKIAEKNKKAAVDQQQQPTTVATVGQENYNGGTSKSNGMPSINHRDIIKPTNTSSSGSKLFIGKSSSSIKSSGGSADNKKMSSTQKAIFMAKRTKKKMSPTSSSASNTTNVNTTNINKTTVNSATNKSKSAAHSGEEPPATPHRAIHPFSGTPTKNQLSFNINDIIYLDFNNLSSNGWVWGYMIKAGELGGGVVKEGKVGGMGKESEEDREYGWCPLSYLVEVKSGDDNGRDAVINKKEEVRRQEEVKSSANIVKTKEAPSTEGSKTTTADSKETTIAKTETTTTSSSSTTTTRTTNTTNNTTSNIKSKDDKMKQLFAARRRKAQIEMKNMPLLLNSSTVSAASTIGGGESVASSSIDNDTLSLSGSVKTLGSSVMDSADGSSKDGNASCDGNSSTAKSVGSAKPPKSTYSSRRALDRYLGKKSTSTRGNKNNKSGGSSVGSSASTKDTKSTLDGDNDDDDEDISTLGSTSMDSMDNSHTALSSSSRGGGAGSGTILSPVREETFFHSGGGISSSDLARSSSVSTVLIDNTSSATGGIVKDDTVTSMIDEENGTKVMENDSSITGQQHLGELMNESSTNGILRDRAYSKDDVNTNERHDEEQPPEKSVRFHLSPLEKMQREKEREKAQCSPPRVGALTLENDDGNAKDSEEVSQQLEVCDDAENDNSHVFESNTTAAHDMVEEDVEFTKFMAALRKEVAGDHKELWSGFQSILGRSPSEQVPLDKSCVAESPTVPKYDENGKKIRKKKIPMDPHTQESLTTIHRYMVENPRVKNRFMTDSSQLVGDKKLKKERRNQSKLGGDKVVEKQQEVVLASTPVRKPASNEAKVSPPIRPRSSSKEKSAEVKSKNKPSMDSSVHSSSSSKARGESNSTQLSPQKSKKSSKPPPSSSSSTKKLSPTKKLLARMSSSRSTASGSSNGTSESQSPKKSLSWRETLKMKQKALKMKQLDNDNVNDSPDEDKSPMVVTLRRVSPRKKQRMAPTSSSPTETESPWSNVQLRTTPKMRESMCSIGQTPNSSSEQPSTISLHPVIQSKGSWNSTSSSTSSWVNVLPPVTDTPKQITTEPSSSTLPSLCCVGDSIDLDALPKRVFPTDEGEAAVFQLKANEKENKKVVIVGKTAIVTAALSFSSTSSGTARKASITWWARRSDIRALTLNVEATGATLAHSQGRTPLLFESADVCLEFAQAFYRGPSTKPQEVETSSSDNGEKTPSGKELSANTKQSSITERGESSSAARLKSLTEEEESLLDKYRQYSQDERTKLRLTCNSPQGGEPREVEVSLSPLSGGQTALPKKNEDNTASSLSEEEEKVASKYRKMLKMGIPPDAVKHKMTSDAVEPKIMNAVLDVDKPREDTSKEGGGKKLSDEEEATVSKFRKMMKMGVPADGVRHKMMMEGVDAKLIDAVFDESTKQEESTKDTSSAIPKLSSEEEIIANKYRKMLKMGVPLEGVEHKMKQESVDLKIISAIVEEASPSSSNDSSQNETVAKKPSKPQNSAKSVVGGPALSKEEEKIASKYRGMLKVCIPKDAVLHKMKQEDVSAKIVEAVLGKEYVTGNGGESAAATPAKATNRKTIAFHWTTQNLAPELLERSIFGMKKRKLQSINPEESDIKKLEELFQKRNNSNTAKKKSGSNQDESSSDMAKILDLTRANNIAISLKAFNDFTFRSLAETINDLDPDCKIVGERVEFIPNLLPSPKEIQAIKKYNGDDDKLITAELFFRQLVPVKRIEDKVKVMKTMSTFEEHVEEARAGFNTLQEVCSQVMESDKLIAVLELVLNIGNVMNTGTLDGGVEAFKFESLSRLSQTKSADGKTTVLDYIVETFIEKGERQALMLMSEFPDIQDSSRLLIGDLLGDMNTLRKDYKLCKTELASMKRDQSKKKASSMPKKANVDEGGDPRKALFAAIQSRGSAKEDDSPKQEESSDPRQALFAAIKKKGEATKDDSSPTSSSSNVKYTPGVHRLSKFLIHSKSILCRAERDQDEAIRACKVRLVCCFFCG